ncbi:MAG: hypothetical protein ACE5FA_04305, partial [Dehalococcoidia bacterium]
LGIAYRLSDQVCNSLFEHKATNRLSDERLSAPKYNSESWGLTEFRPGNSVNPADSLSYLADKS